MATLIGYGAAAINPYLMFESLDELADRALLPEDLDREEAEKRIVKAIGKGLLKTISKMGISTIQSYCGAQIFEAVGLEPDVIDRHFTGTASRIGGVGLDAALDRGDGAPLPRLPAHRPRAAAGRRRPPVAPRRRDAHLEPGHDRQAPARGRAARQRRLAHESLRGVRAVRSTRTRRGGAVLRGTDEAAYRRGRLSARRGRARDRDRQALHARAR